MPCTIKKTHRSFRLFTLCGFGVVFWGGAPLQAQNLDLLKAAQSQGLLSGGGSGGATIEKAPVNPPSGSIVAVRPAKGKPLGFEATKLRPFGEGLLGSGRNIPSPVDLPTPADYIVGAGDTVELRVFGKENHTDQLVIGRDGRVTIPDIGPVVVAGMTYEEMSRTLLERISKQKIGIQATITMGALRSIQVSLMGDVNQPGAYTTDALTTITNALILGGGIKSNGSLRRVELRRNGKVLTRLDLYASLLRGDTRHDLRLQAGDVIFVPPVGRRVAIDGPVLRPAIYELLGERSINEVLSLAGGLLPTAYANRSKLDRVTLSGLRQVSDISLISASQRQLPVQDGDIVTIGSVINRNHNAVELTGAVERTGSYEWRPGFTLSRVIPDAETLALNAYRALAVIQRLDPLTGIPYFKPVNLLAQLQGKHDEPLERNDQVIILSREDVDFLSSAKVQAVLAGRIAQAISSPKKSKAAVQITAEDLGQSKASEALQQEDSADKVATRAQKMLAQESKTEESDLDDRQGQSLDLQCKGLEELAVLVDSEGASRFRSALLIRGSGKEADALKVMACTSVYQSTPALLPYLLEQAISLRGEVKTTAILPVPEKFPMDLAIRMAGGLSRSADHKGIELSRPFSQDDVAQIQRTIIPASQQKNTLLEPGDIVMVRRQVSEQDNGVVRLAGEFQHAGSYDIKRGERLSEVIARAGGITRHAYPYGAVFLRDRIKTEKAEYYGRMAQELTSSVALSMSRVGSSATAANPAGVSAMQSLIANLKSIQPSGRMVVEADPVALLAHPEVDVVLEPGDEIIMPKRPATVLVMGEVLNPGAVQFQPGLRSGDYLKYAGGISRAADDSRAYLILPNGAAEPVKLSAWNFQATPVPPGSTLYIPRDPMPFFAIDYFSVSLSVIKDLALTAAALKTVTK